MSEFMTPAFYLCLSCAISSVVLLFDTAYCLNVYRKKQGAINKGLFYLSVASFLSFSLYAIWSGLAVFIDDYRVIKSISDVILSASVVYYVLLMINMMEHFSALLEWWPKVKRSFLAVIKFFGGLHITITIAMTVTIYAFEIGDETYHLFMTFFNIFQNVLMAFASMIDWSIRFILLRLLVKSMQEFPSLDSKRSCKADISFMTRLTLFTIAISLFICASNAVCLLCISDRSCQVMTGQDITCIFCFFSGLGLACHITATIAFQLRLNYVIRENGHVRNWIHRATATTFPKSTTTGAPAQAQN